MKINISDELSTLTTVDLLAINRLLDKVRWCASDAVAKASQVNDRTVDLDLGFGDIILNLEDDRVKYKFIPSKLLERCVIDSYINKNNGLDLKLEKSLASKLTTIYKEMF